MFNLRPRHHEMRAVFYDGQNVAEVDCFLHQHTDGQPTFWCTEALPHMLLPTSEGFIPVVSPHEWVIWDVQVQAIFTLPDGFVRQMYDLWREDGELTPA